LLAVARSGSYRSVLNYYLGVVAPDQSGAAAHYRAPVQAAPTAPAAQAAPNELQELGNPYISTFEAGETRFEQDRYREADQAYAAYLERNPSGPQASQARYGRGVALVRLCQDRAGVSVLQVIARAFPGTAAAVDGLNRAGRVWESLYDLDGAEAAHQATANHPGSPSRSQDALFRLGFITYRRGDFARAKQVWRPLASQRADAADRTLAQFWLGKALESSGDSTSASAAWTAARDLDPGGYYSLRAGDYLAGGEARVPCAQAARSLAAVRQIDEARLAGEVRCWASARVSGSGVPGEILATAEARLASDPGVQQAERLLAVGLRREATWEPEKAADRLADDVTALALSTTWEHTRGLYHPEMIQ
jgi:tetratricopeptide (TPR) repeat protein